LLVLSKPLGIPNAGVDSSLLLRVGERRNGAGVIGAGALGKVARWAISLEVDNRDDWLVDWQLLIVGTEAVTVGIGIGEKTGLKDRVSRWLNVGDEMGWREGSL